MAGKRHFYEDEELITTKPGFNTEISAQLKEKESAHGDIAYVDGMGVRTTPYLEKHLNAFRLYAHDKLSVAAAELGTQVSALGNEFNYLKSKIDEVVVDPVVPNLVNVVFPILVTSVLVHRRSLPVRFAVSTFVAGAAVKYYMPHTYDAAKTKLVTWERESLPELYESQQQLAASLYAHKEATVEHGQYLKLKLRQQVHEAREWIQKTLDD